MSIRPARIPRYVGTLPSGLQRVLLMASQSGLPGPEETRRTRTDSYPAGVGSTEANWCCRTAGGGSCLEGRVYPRFHSVGRGEDFVSQPRKDHGGDANWKRVAGLVRLHPRMVLVVRREIYFHRRSR